MSNLAIADGHFFRNSKGELLITNTPLIQFIEDGTVHLASDPCSKLVYEKSMGYGKDLKITVLSKDICKNKDQIQAPSNPHKNYDDGEDYYLPQSVIDKAMKQT